MPRKDHTIDKEQILCALRARLSGACVSELCREYGISETTFYTWKEKKYPGWA